MTTKVKQLHRLERLRVAKERLQQAAFARAQASVAATESEIEACMDARQAAVELGRAGLVKNDWQAWWMGDSVAALAERTEQSLRQQREERSRLAEQARLLFSESRRSAEQARLLLEQSRLLMQREEDRRAQNASDDRFAARAYWLKMQRDA